LLKTAAELTREFEIREQQIDTHGDPDLRHHGVLRGAEEGLYLEVLLDPFEEQFDLPAGLVDRCDGAGRETEVVGQEHVTLSGFGIDIADPTQWDRASARLGSGQFDGLIAGQPLRFIDGSPFDDAVAGLFLHPRNEKDILGIQSVKPSIVIITAVEDDHAVPGQRQSAPSRDVVGLAVGDAQERRQVPAVIDPDMQFDCALGGAELGPGKHRKAQFNGRGIEGVELVFEAEAVSWCLALAATE